MFELNLKNGVHPNRFILFETLPGTQSYINQYKYVSLRKKLVKIRNLTYWKICVLIKTVVNLEDS